MYATMSATVKRALFSLAFGIGLIFAGPTGASAHTVEIRPGFVRIHYEDSRAVILPRWLLGHREFRHWYGHNRHAGRARLYEIYRFERRHRGHGPTGRHGHYHEHGHRCRHTRRRQ